MRRGGRGWHGAVVQRWVVSKGIGRGERRIKGPKLNAVPLRDVSEDAIKAV